MNLHVFSMGKRIAVETNPGPARAHWERQRFLRPDLHITLLEIPK